MDLTRVLAGMLLWWAVGLFALVALPRRGPGLAAPGEVAFTIGAGGLTGMFLSTLWLRALSAAGVGFGLAAVAVVPVAVTVALAAFIARRDQVALPPIARDALAAFTGRALGRASRVVWWLLLAWLALRFALLFAEVATRPLYPWDAWTQWATKARVWYELSHLAQFVRPEAWFDANGAAYTDAGADYPGTVGLMQVMACVFLGRWDDALMNIPFWCLAVAFAFVVYGALRGMAFSALFALVGTWLVASLPLANTHVALAGYADLPLAIYFTTGVLCVLRWLGAREPVDALVAVFMIAACLLLKVPGRIWALLTITPLVVGLLPRQGLKVARAGFAAAVLVLLVLAQTSPEILGYRIHLDFAPDTDALARSFLLYDNWHLLWYGAVAVAIFGARRAVAPDLAPFTVVIVGGVLFLAVVLLFTNAREWVTDQSTVNRASLHLAPLVTIWMCVVYRACRNALRPVASVAPPAAVTAAP